MPADTPPVDPLPIAVELAKAIQERWSVVAELTCAPPPFRDHELNSRGVPVCLRSRDSDVSRAVRAQTACEVAKTARDSRCRMIPPGRMALPLPGIWL